MTHDLLELAPLSEKESLTLPDPVGTVEGYYTIHSELATMPFTIGKGIKNMDFIVTYPHEFTRTIALLNLMLTSNYLKPMARREANRLWSVSMPSTCQT